MYSDHPSETARRWLEAGTSWLHVVNLDGAFGEVDNANRLALENILQVAKEFNAGIQFGGGLRSVDAIDASLSLGVNRVVLGTVAVEKSEVVQNAIQKFGVEHIAVGIDARDGIVRVRGWKDNSGISAKELALQLRNMGLRTVIFTDVSRDGLGSGLNISATRELANLGGLDVIASGGVHTIDGVGAARNANLAGVIVGRALYEGTIDLEKALQIEC
jgi:phosphoribosylformimino-5-aminoimidazole carboxamide ribotide isomerase